MNESEALVVIGTLIKQARLQKGFAQKPFAVFAGVDTKTLASMENGTRMAWEVNQRKVEDALGWRAGAIQEVMDNAANTPAASVTLDTLREGGAEASWQDLDAEEQAKKDGPVTRANLLTDEELLAELSYRFRNYHDRLHPEK